MRAYIYASRGKRVKGARAYYGTRAILVAMYQYLQNYSSYEHAACYTRVCTYVQRAYEHLAL